eukprot:TRINITY_DN229_c0_g2_i1.p1 TRINITY_DN229_c0_g2~~TRINITY_DN229_c0_g2_i1.p1  ORF type:complete len:493 (-),score=172.70 TRINITY_DN229_c0_g2_i1:19-1308(-)
MPALSPTMEQGNIASWKKKVGDKISAGDVLAEIETDKATMEMESTEDGFLAKILLPSGAQGVKVGTAIAVRVENQADVEKFADYVAEGAPAAAPKPAPAAAPKTAAPAAAPAAPAPAPAPAAAAPPAPPAPAAPSQLAGKVFASPLARAQASAKGIDLTGVAGSGPQGRVVAADVSEFKAASFAAPAPAIQVTPGQLYTDFPNSNIRKVIASRLTLSKQTIPHYYLTINCRVDELLQIRAKLNAQANNKYKLSVNDFIVKAAALALKRVPEANSTWQDDFIRRYHTVDINVAVNSPQGLFTPLIKDADKIGLQTINGQVKELAEKAKAGKLTPTDLSIGTFTISNLGMFGIDQFAAVINPPQACILAVGSTTKQVIVTEEGEGKKEKFSIANIMNVTLSCDHRVVDGAVGAQWLAAFRDYVENPLKLLL